MNNNGTVVFMATVNCGVPGGCTAIYQTSVGSAPLPVATRGTVIAGQSLGGAFNPKIDDSGTILFNCVLNVGVGVGIGACTQSAVLAKPGETIGGKTIPSIVDTWISGNGAIVISGQSNRFSPALDPGTALVADSLFTPTGFLLKTCESLISGTFFTPCDSRGAAGDTISGKTLISIGFPTINNSGAIAFLGGLSLGNNAIFSLSSLLASTGATIGGHTLTNIGIPLINNTGTIVFKGEYSGVNGVAGIFTPSAALIQTGDTIDGHVLDAIVGPTGINDSGSILFISHFQAQPGVPQGWGIFTNSDLVIREGDTIGGKTTTIITPVWINNNGSILLGTQFSDGTQAVVLAQPGPSVAIAVKGDESPAVIKSESNGKIPVAILSNLVFDAATSVDRTSLTFGRTGNESSLAFCSLGQYDVNGDGRPDVLCHFDTQLTGLKQGDTTAVLKGKTTAGTPFSASAAIRVLH